MPGYRRGCDLRRPGANPRQRARSAEREPFAVWRNSRDDLLRESERLDQRRVPRVVVECMGPPDPDLRGVFETFLYYEADLLDRGEFEAWYDLFAEDGLYWVPIGDDGDNPGRAVSVAFDDHRRLGDRIAWMKTGDVHSHQPPSVTQRMISNVTQRMISNVMVWPIDEETALARSAFTLHAHRRGVTDSFAGRHEHVLHMDEGRPTMIRMKKAVLVDRSSALHNLTIIL